MRIEFKKGDMVHWVGGGKMTSEYECFGRVVGVAFDHILVDTSENFKFGRVRLFKDDITGRGVRIKDGTHPWLATEVQK